MTRRDVLQLLGIIIVFAIVIGVGATALRSRSQPNNPALVNVQIGDASPTPVATTTTLLGNTTTTIIVASPQPTVIPVTVIDTRTGTYVTAPTTTQTKGGLTTSGDTAPGQVLVQNEDGTMYLTTETTDDPNNPPTVVVDDAISAGLFGVRAPEGFAKDFGQLLNSVLTIVMVIAALLVFFYLIWGGIEWITSGGDKGKTDKAREKMVSAVIGLIIVAASFAILNLALNFLGFDNLNDVFRSARPLDGSLPAPTPTPSPTPSPSPSPIP